MKTPIDIESRTTTYANRVDWVRGAKRGGPDFHMGGTSAFEAMQRPWSCWQNAHSWDADREAAREEASELDDGIYWEDDIIQYAAERHGFRVLSAAGADEPFRVQHPVHEWLNASPDAICRHPVWGLGVVDAKTAWSRDLWGEDGAVLRFNAAALGSVPEPKYLTQLAVLAECIGADWCGLVVGLHFRDVRFLRFEARPEYTGKVVERVAEWRQRHLVEGVEPAYDASAESVNYMARRLAEVTREAEPHEAELAEAYRLAGDAEKAAKTRKAGLKGALVKALSEYEPEDPDAPKGQHKLLLPNGGRLTVAKNGAIRVTPPKEDEE